MIAVATALFVACRCHDPETGKRVYCPGSPFNISVSSNVNEVVTNKLDTTGAHPRDYRVLRSVFEDAQVGDGCF